MDIAIRIYKSNTHQKLILTMLSLLLNINSIFYGSIKYILEHHVLLDINIYNHHVCIFKMMIEINFIFLLER